MLIFKKIRWKNLLSTGNVFTEIDLTIPGTTLIVGINGAGKSTILDALTFALFGKPFRNINKPQLINSITKKDMIVEIEFHINSNEYTIIRGIKPNVFEVYCNGKLINQSSEVKDYQSILEKQILKINYKSFCQVIVLGSASFVPFMQLPAAQRRMIIEDLLDLEIFTTMNNILKEQIQNNQQFIVNNENSKRLIEAKIKLVIEHLQELKNKTEKFTAEKKQTIIDLKLNLNSFLENRQKIVDRINILQQDGGDHQQFKNKLETLKNLRSQMQTKNRLLLKEIEFYQNNDNCPTCQQKIDNKFKCNTVKDKTLQIKELEDGLEKLSKKYNDTNESLNAIIEIYNNINSLNSELMIIDTNINHYNNQISFLNKEIIDAKNHELNTNDEKLIDLENEQLKINIEYNELYEQRQIYSAASIMLKDGGIKTKIINQYIPIINKLINKYLSEFDLFVEFQLDEQFNETIKSRHRDEFSYSSFSEGEKQKIDLAILFTWRAVAKLRNSLNTNILILDEIFDSSLDGNAADDLLKILNNISKDSNVFIISHRDNLFEKFNNTIKFIKRQNFSAIEA
jgi:hypothetical protein